MSVIDNLQADRRDVHAKPVVCKSLRWTGAFIMKTHRRHACSRKASRLERVSRHEVSLPTRWYFIPKIFNFP